MYTETDRRMFENRFLRSAGRLIAGIVEQREDTGSSYSEMLAIEFEKAYMALRGYLDIMEEKPPEASAVGSLAEEAAGESSDREPPLSISAGRTWYGYRVCLPGLLRSRKRRSRNYLAFRLARELETMEGARRIGPCILVIHQVYNRRASVRDADNVETSQVINVLAQYLFSSDAGIDCYQMHTAEYAPGAERSTCFFVVERASFPEFWDAHTGREGTFCADTGE